MDCFEIAWRRFDPDAPFRLPWLLQTARNLIGDSYRRRGRERAGFSHLVADAGNAAAESQARFERIEVELALLRLRAADREVLELVYWDGLSATEVAEVLGCRTPAAWKKLSRARDALRSLLEQQPDMAASPTRPTVNSLHLQEGMVSRAVE